MKHLSLFPILFITWVINAQIVTTTPAIPTTNDVITLYFNAEGGTGGLANYSGDIYVHIGVITEKSSDGADWKYVKAEWNENTEACKMKRESANLYSLMLSPDLHSYFACPADEKIQRLAMVFRSADGASEGKDTGGNDIYVDIYDAGLNLSFERTKGYVLDEPGAVIAFTANASAEAKLEISIDGVVKKTAPSTKSISLSETFASAGDFRLIAKAILGDWEVSDTIDVCILNAPVAATRPDEAKDGINYNSPASVTFVLHAPHKNSVLLLGDFNNWKPSNAYLLKKDGDHHWITVDGLTPGEEYAFQYLVDKSMAIADPYCEKVLDPWNDKWISSSTYPNLKAYPKGADGIVGVISPGTEAYTWDVTDFTPPPNDKLVVYELLVRDFVHSQDIKDVTKKLNYLDELGVTAIELLPVNEFEGNNSWGYNPSFYFAFDKNYGTKNDYKAFIDSCHARGIAVIMDIALNHAYFQCPLVELYFDKNAGEWGQPSAQNPWFNTTSPNTAYSWGADFDHSSPHTQAFVDRVVAHWLTEYKIDGFRFDFTKGFTNTSGDGWAYDQSRINILKRIYDKLKAVNSDAYMILEHFADNNEEKELANYGMMTWGNNNHAYMQCAMGWKDGASIAAVSHKNKGWNYPNLLAYQESHDEERMMYKSLKWGNENKQDNYSVKTLTTALSRQKLAAAMFLPIPGPKMIWQFGELGYGYSINHCPDGSEKDDCRTSEKPLHWDYYNDQNRRDVYDVYAQLNKLKVKYPVFSSWNHSITENSNFTKVINIYSETTDVTVIGNFDVSAQWVEPNFSSTGKWYEFFSGDSISVTSKDMGIQLQAGEYRLYSKIKLTVNEAQDIDLQAKDVEHLNLKIYPNPARDKIYIEAGQIISSLRLFSVSGALVGQQQIHAKHGQISISGIPAGIYLLQVNSGDDSSFTRVVIE